MKKAFTLIELLVVIAIIALLSTLSVVALNSARVKARDARRLSDVGQIRTALSMYYDSAKSFPASLTTGQPIGYGSMVFLSKMPSDPISANQYTYTQTNDGSSYTLDFTLEADSGGYTTGNYQLTPNGVIAGGGGSTPPLAWSCGENLIDGAESYKTQEVEGSCIMTTSIKKDSNGRLCFDDEPGNCEEFGGLYKASQAHGICPEGWRLPMSSDSLNILENLPTPVFGKFKGYFFSKKGIYDPSTAFLMLKEKDYVLNVDSKNIVEIPWSDSAVSVRCVKDL